MRKLFNHDKYVLLIKLVLNIPRQIQRRIISIQTCFFFVYFLFTQSIVLAPDHNTHRVAPLVRVLYLRIFKTRPLQNIILNSAHSYFSRPARYILSGKYLFKSRTRQHAFLEQRVIRPNLILMKSILSFSFLSSLVVNCFIFFATSVFDRLILFTDPGSDFKIDQICIGEFFFNYYYY